MTDDIDIPTAVTAAERATLRGLAAGKRVLEVGALLGYSTVALADVAERVVSVDPHDGYPFDNPRPTLEPFLFNLVEHGVREKVTVCIGTHDDVLPYLGDRQFDLVFIDCTGEYDLTLDVIRKVIPKMRYVSTLCVHDCGHPDWPGALDAVRKLRRKFDLVDRMAVMQGVWP